MFTVLLPGAKVLDKLTPRQLCPFWPVLPVMCELGKLARLFCAMVGGMVCPWVCPGYSSGHTLPVMLFSEVFFSLVLVI